MRVELLTLKLLRPWPVTFSELMFRLLGMLIVKILLWFVIKLFEASTKVMVEFCPRIGFELVTVKFNLAAVNPICVLPSDMDWLFELRVLTVTIAVTVDIGLRNPIDITLVPVRLAAGSMTTELLQVRAVTVVPLILIVALQTMTP